MVTLGDYLIVSGMLFAIGFAGVMLRRKLIILLMSLELMLNAANLSLVACSRFRVQPRACPIICGSFLYHHSRSGKVMVGPHFCRPLRARQTTDVKRHQQPEIIGNQ
jgi:multisubunit Na+/H+ antiporter MnhC subunit